MFYFVYIESVLSSTDSLISSSQHRQQNCLCALWKELSRICTTKHQKITLQATDDNLTGV